VARTEEIPSLSLDMPETEETTQYAEPEPQLPPYLLPEERYGEDGRVRSYLTGLWVDAAIGERRPLAIMMSNDKEAAPQYGMNHAGVIYEAPVEAGMNRFMSLIEDFDELERIGSVRSCRTYYTYFARQFEAIYAHFGQSTFAKPYLANVDNLNGIEGKGSSAYYRSTDKKSPHNAYASGEKILDAIDKMGYSLDYPEGYGGNFRFARDVISLADAPGAVEAYKVTPGYVYNKPWFEYNEAEYLYYRFQYGKAHLGDEGQLAVTNILLLYCPYAHYATTAYLNINVHGDNYGYYVTRGAAVPIHWIKDTEFGVTRYYDGDGEEIILNQGKTWICIIGITAKAGPNVEFEGRPEGAGVAGGASETEEEPDEYAQWEGSGDW
jgi:hypothetical protein